MTKNKSTGINLRAKERLDKVLKGSRVDWYKPIQIAEVLHKHRLGDLDDLSSVSGYANLSCRWRDEITLRLTGKRSTSSQKYQHDIWNDHAMPPDILSVLAAINKANKGDVEKYIYQRYAAKQGTVESLIDYIRTSGTKEFDLGVLLGKFESVSGLKRSIDKAYEIVSYALFETIVLALKVKVEVSVGARESALLNEFADLVSPLLGIEGSRLEYSFPAHIYRVGVTNAADRGLDMWANFGPAVQVKHLTLNAKLAKAIVGQVESDRVLIVCTDADKPSLEAIFKQIGWGQRVCGIVTQTDLERWYRKCLHGRYKLELGQNLLDRLLDSFLAEFPQADNRISEFLTERGYDSLAIHDDWKV